MAYKQELLNCIVEDERALNSVIADNFIQKAYSAAASNLRIEKARREASVYVEEAARVEVQSSGKGLKALSEYGIVTGTDFTTMSTQSLEQPLYNGIPIKGATSGVLHIHADKLSGSSFTPEKSSFKPTLVPELRRPAFANSSSTIGDHSTRTGAGSSVLRDVAISNQFDGAIADRRIIDSMVDRGLVTLSHSLLSN